MAILMLLVENRDSMLKSVKEKSRNIEILLADAGLSNFEIAKIVNKNLPAVQKAVQRGRKK